jgi:two-component system NtrC family sensor kinase
MKSKSPSSSRNGTGKRTSKVKSPGQKATSSSNRATTKASTPGTKRQKNKSPDSIPSKHFLAAPSHGKVKSKHSKEPSSFPTPPSIKTSDQLLRFVESIKQQWMATIDALVDPLTIVDKNYVIQKANLAMAEIADRNVKQVIGKKCYEVFAQRKSPCIGCKIAKNPKQSASNFELDGIRGNKFYEVSSQALRGMGGEGDSFVQIYRDRTEARKMRDQLAQQDKLASIGLLAGGIAHEINNPLGGILIFSQMLLKELPKNSPHYQDVVEIEAATQRCKTIVESLLDFARQSPRDPKGTTTRSSVFDAIRTAIRFGRVSIPKSNNVEIFEEFLDFDHVVMADRNRIIQVFLNLAQNAIQAMPDGGQLSIRASNYYNHEIKKYMGVYEIEDTGIGIPPENLPRIFDPFFTTKDPGEGTGLGLALCYGIVQDLQGSMSVESTVNVGTKFTIKIPLEEVALKHPAAG